MSTGRATSLGPPAVFGIAGYSGSGKTTLVERLIPLLGQHGLRVSVIKHAHHEFDVDQPGKDSFRHRQAGAGEVLVSSARRWALMHEHRGAAEPDLRQLLTHLSPCDLVLVEGFKRDPMAKLEVHRAVLGKPLLFPADDDVVALACADDDRQVIAEAAGKRGLSVLDLNQPEVIAAFIIDWLARVRTDYPQPEPRDLNP